MMMEGSYSKNIVLGRGTDMNAAGFDTMRVKREVFLVRRCSGKDPLGIDLTNFHSPLYGP
jgi:hypothetical protein